MREARDHEQFSVPVAPGGWSSYGVAQRKKREAEAKMKKLRKKK
ncbi:hypothetical protein [Streptomyces lunaelactis]|nr:hypothetical protein [Streptomyces lunaelactis]